MNSTADNWLADATSCRLTTRGRHSGDQHVVTVWFCLDGATVYVLSRHGEDGDWVRNLRSDPMVSLSHRSKRQVGEGRVVGDPDEHRRGREAMYAKYSPKYKGLEGWLSEAVTVIAVDLS